MRGVMKSVLAGLALWVALTACSADVDERAWRSDIEAELGSPIGKWEQFRDVWIDVCDENDEGFRSFIAVALDGGDSVDSLRTNVRHACPDRLEELEALRSDLASIRNVCEVPVDERTEDQDLIAEAMGC